MSTGSTLFFFWSDWLCDPYQETLTTAQDALLDMPFLVASLPSKVDSESDDSESESDTFKVKAKISVS